MAYKVVIPTYGRDYKSKLEGYIMLEYDGRKPFKKDQVFTLKAYWPENYDNEDMIGELRLNNPWTWNELMELYLDNKESIDSLTQANIFINFEDPDYYDALTLADSVDAYLRLDQY